MEQLHEPYTRHDEVPIFERRSGTVNATFYNHVQVAQKRIGKQLRMKIPGLRTLDLILLPDAWIVVDRALNDLPIAAWSDFEREQSSALHSPVACRIRLYHGNAGMILQRVLEQMDGKLNTALQSSNHHVIGFRKRDES